MERAKTEGRKAESGGGILGAGAETPSPSARESGQHCELPQRGSGRTTQRFSTIFSTQDGLS